MKDIQKKRIRAFNRINGKKLNSLAEESHDLVFNQINCLECANCCKSIPPMVNETDIRRMARHLNLKVGDFKEQYVRYDDDMDMVLKKSPCPFLQSDNKCLIYESRPKACREYPHTNGFQFSKNLKLHAINANYCPAVYHILEDLSKKIQ